MTMRGSTGTFVALITVLVASNRSPAVAQLKDQLVQAPRLAAPERGSIQGALSGIGFTAAELARGAFRIPLPISVPEDRGPLQAGVIPVYSPDAGLSEWGMGWATDLSIKRYRSIGEIDYVTDELISPWGLLSQGDDGRLYPRGLAAPIRVQSAGADWVATGSDGTQYRFTAAAGMRTTRGSYSWQLTDIVNPVGDRTTLEWTPGSSGRPYLTRVMWGGRGQGPQYELALDYETVATAFIDHATGAALDRRVTRVEVAARDASTGALRERWHYQIGYRAAPFGPAFYLETIQRVFASGEAEPAMTYRYELDDARLPAAPLDHYDGLNAVLDGLGGDLLQPDRSTIYDLDADGRPDLENAAQLTVIQHTDGGWTQAPLPAAVATRSECRPRPNEFNPPRMLARLTADIGEPHVVYTARRSTAPLTSQVLVCDRLGHEIVDLVVPDDWELGPNIRLADVDHDRRPDLVRISQEGVDILHNDSDAQGLRFAPLPRFAWTLGFQPDTSWLHDFDGDGNVDITVRGPDGLYVFYGLGGRQWTTTAAAFSFVTERGDELGAIDQYQVTFVDANKDGLADILLTHNIDTFLFTNRGAYFGEVPVSGFRSVELTFGVPVITDITGNGDTEVVFPGRGTTHVVSLATPATGLLASADDGMGTVARFTYQRSAPVAGAEQRLTVLDTLTVESSGHDTVSYRYSYGAPVLHTASKQLVGYASVDKHSPQLTEHLAFLNDDDVAGIHGASEDLDDRTPGIVRFTRRYYDDVQFHHVRWLRPSRVETGHRDPSGGVELATTTQYVTYERGFCPTVVASTSPAGQLLSVSSLASVAAVPDELHCLARAQRQIGTHADPALDFSYLVDLERNDLGQVTRITQFSPTMTLLVAQEIGYDADHHVASVGAPGRGTALAGYDALGRLDRVTDPTGVVTRVAERAPVSDALHALATVRPDAPSTAYFRYDGRERLQALWDDVSGASAAQPLAAYSYQDATNTTPGRIDARALADAVTGTSRRAVDLVAADGKPLVSGSWLGDHFAFGVASITFRATLTQRSSFVGAMTDAAVSALTSDALRALGTPLVETVAAGFGHPIQVTTTQQAGVVGTVTRELALGATEVITRIKQPGGFTAEVAVDASGDLVRKTDENGVTHRYTYDALGRLVHLETPDGAHTVLFDGFARPAQIARAGIGAVTYTYDPVTGLPVRKQRLDASGAVIDTSDTRYDAIGRPIQVAQTAANDATTLAFDHDGQLDGASVPGQLGRLTRVRGDGWERSSLFDPLGRVYQERTTLTGWRALTSDQTYRTDGSVASRSLTITDPAGSVRFRSTTQTTLDGLGRAATLRVDGSVLYTLTYDDEGRVERADFTSGEAIVFDYDPVTHQRRGHQIEAPASSGGVHWDRDPRGLVSDETYVHGTTTTRRDYRYDGRGALLSATSATDVASYSYTASGLPETISDLAGARSVHPTASTLVVGDVAYTWDAAGRVVGKGEWAFDYGGSGQLRRADRPGRHLEFVYDDAGNRLIKRVDGEPVRADVAGGVLTEDHFIELISVGGVVAGVLDNGQFTALLTDPRGTPFAGPDGTPGLASPYGVRASHLGLAEVIDYARLGWDPDLEVVRMGVRDYDPTLSQFLTPDPLYFEDLDRCQASPLQCALYGYAGGNPISFVDPSGMDTTGLSYIHGADELDWRINTTRVAGALEVWAGASIASNGVAVCTSIAGCVAGGLAFTYGVAVAANGLQELITGEPSRNLVNRAITSVTNQSTADGFDLAAAAMAIGSALSRSPYFGPPKPRLPLTEPPAAGLPGGDRELGLLSSARAARDAKASELGPLRSPARPATITAGYNTETGKVAVGCSGGGCAEGKVVEQLGGDPAKVRFTEAVRPRPIGPPFKEVPVCETCEGKYGRSPFPQGTMFQSDKVK